MSLLSAHSVWSSWHLHSQNSNKEGVEDWQRYSLRQSSVNKKELRRQRSDCGKLLYRTGKWSEPNSTKQPSGWKGRWKAQCYNNLTERWWAMPAETVFEDGQELNKMIEQWQGERSPLLRFVDLDVSATLGASLATDNLDPTFPHFLHFDPLFNFAKILFSWCFSYLPVCPPHLGLGTHKT